MLAGRLKAPLSTRSLPEQCCWEPMGTQLGLMVGAETWLVAAITQGLWLFQETTQLLYQSNAPFSASSSNSMPISGTLDVVSPSPPPTSLQVYMHCFSTPRPDTRAVTISQLINI